MRAAWYDRQGPATEVLVVGDLPDPLPGPGELRVRVSASGINPTDLYARSGSRGGPMAFPRIIPHQDGAGVVDAVGQGVDGARLGEAVWVTAAQWQRPWGTAAELVVVPADRAVPIPPGTSQLEAACLGVPWHTAHAAVAACGPIAGRSVLVTGGLGAVGFYAVQLAAARGARVIATVRSAEDGNRVRAAGADATVRHGVPGLADEVQVLTAGRGVAAIVESQFAANVALLPAIAGQGVTVAVYGSSQPETTFPASWAIRNRATFRFVYSYLLDADERDSAVVALRDAASSGRLHHLPVRALPLSRIAEAHERVERGNHGVRTVVVPAPPRPADRR